MRSSYPHKIAIAVIALIVATAGLVFASGGDKSPPIVIVADSRRLSSVPAWFANLYNESHILFTVITLIIIPAVGFVLGILADWIMHRVGIDLKSRDLAEH